jgi:hypothetical protein
MKFKTFVTDDGYANFAAFESNEYGWFERWRTSTIPITLYHENATLESVKIPGLNTTGYMLVTVELTKI